jgi:hypothetical protein
MNKEPFKRKKISAILTFTEEAITDPNLVFGTTTENFINAELTAKLDAFIYERGLDVIRKSHIFKRPTFLEWLLRKQRYAVFDIEINELLLKPPTVGTKYQIDINRVYE